MPGVSEIGGLVHTNKRLQAATTDNLVSGECGEKATWSYNKTTKTLTISGSGEMYSYLYLGYVDEVSDPEELLPWFDFRTEIKKIVIGDKITNIGQSAFYECTSLEEVKLGKKVTKIEEYAFCGCRALKTINFTDELEYIGYGAFFECENITKLYIGKKLKIDKYEIDSFSGVKQVKVHAKNKYYTAQGNSLLNKKKTKLLLAWFGSDTTCHVSAKVTSIERDLFENPDMKNFKVSSKNKKFSSENAIPSQVSPCVSPYSSFLFAQLLVEMLHPVCTVLYVCRRFPYCVPLHSICSLGRAGRFGWNWRSKLHDTPLLRTDAVAAMPR